ncbi:hypothetical protein EDD17DRAFT_1509297 [Pisolithus thermaeus]|nr:hypothetical protein EDD17DRAFT_1509297 [Pisolithus thermaeus]
MPQGNEEGVPRFSGHPDNLIWFLEDIRDLCMQAGCFEDHEWARWSIYYLGIEEFECPTVCYSKCDLYNLVNKQKKVKIDSYKALLNYQLCFMDIALSWIEKDDLFLEGFNQEFQGEILQRLKWNNRRQYVDDPWPTYQVAQEAEGLLKEGYRFKLREAHLARDQWSTREAQCKAEMRELRGSTLLKIQSLTHSLQDSSKPLEAPGEGSRSQAVEVDSIEVPIAELSSPPLVEGQCKTSFEHIEVTLYIAEESLTAELQGECLRGNIEEQSKGKVLGAKNPPIEPQDAQDELRVNEQPVGAVACAPEVPKPTLESRGDLHEVPEQAGSEKVEEIESGVEAEGQLKVVAWRKPPEAKIRRKTLKSVSQTIKEILPEFQITHNSRMDSESQSRDLHDESECAYAAAVEIYTSLSQKSKNYLFEGYEVYEGKVKAPHSGGWSAILESTAIPTTRKSTKEAALRVRTPQILCKKKWMPPCVEGEAQQLLYGVLHQVFKATRLGIEPKQSPGPHWHSGQDPSLTLRVFMFFLECMKVSEESDEHKTPSRLICRPCKQLTLNVKHRARRLKFTLEGALGLPRRHSLEHEGEDMRRTRAPYTRLWVEEGYPASIYEYLGHQERAKRWQSKAPP